jgi:2-oxoglutarate dehydrogenase E2 component (dihydrolipoamide succinyltransferase)
MFNLYRGGCDFVKWREKIKCFRKERREVNLYPIFSSCKALKDFPGLNISVDGDYIIKKKIFGYGGIIAQR